MDSAFPPVQLFCKASAPCGPPHPTNPSKGWRLVAAQSKTQRCEDRPSRSSTPSTCRLRASAIPAMSVISSCLGRPRRPKRPQHPPRSTPAVPPPYPHYVYPGLMRFSTCAVPGFDKLCPVRVFTCRPRDSTRQQCTICLEYLVNDRDLVRRLPCAHEFHSNCKSPVAISFPL